MSKKQNQRKTPKDWTGNWYIIDTANNRAYINRPFATQEIAQYALDELMVGFEKNKYWQKKLKIKEIVPILEKSEK